MPTTNLFDLSGRVTGGNGGIGRGIARRFTDGRCRRAKPQSS